MLPCVAFITHKNFTAVTVSHPFTSLDLLLVWKEKFGVVIHLRSLLVAGLAWLTQPGGLSKALVGTGLQLPPAHSTEGRAIPLPLKIFPVISVP